MKLERGGYAGSMRRTRRRISAVVFEVPYQRSRRAEPGAMREQVAHRQLARHRRIVELEPGR